MRVNCQLIERLLSAYIDGELNGTEMMRVRHHVSECDSCRNEHETLVVTKRALSKLPVRMPSNDFEARLISMVMAHAPEPKAQPTGNWLEQFSRSLRGFAPGMRAVAASAGVMTFFVWFLSAGNQDAANVNMSGATPTQPMIFGTQPENRGQGALPFSPGSFEFAGDQNQTVPVFIGRNSSEIDQFVRKQNFIRYGDIAPGYQVESASLTFQSGR